MQEPPRPENEDDRLRALRQLLILDTPPEERFDRLTAFAAQEFDMPIVLLSLIDDERQWFKSRHGLDVCETSRGISFCGHAILQDDTLVVPDVALDARFADNPLVTGEPHIQFYAGAPLRMPGGQNIGTLCLIDRTPRQLDDIDLAILASLRDLAVEELVRRASEEPAP
ncbi:GAF domain-containing protein [Paracidovorax sp. MALMAid1276]|uniref:GAF domain-containing protein n=1 Tax=Paracidovorax sp. MALMAid1276 TaxID=3411631 RepID=UPI003B9C3BBD